jgi:apolipoprotein N-acyltransferase
MFYALGFPIFNGSSIFIGPILGFILFNWALDQEVSLKKQLLLSWVYSLGFYLLGFYWIPFTLSEFGGLFFPFNHLLGLLFSLVIIPQIYFFVILRRKIAHPVFLAFGYVLLEQFIPQQFPAHLGHSWMSLAPSMNLVFAPIAGAAFYSFFSALIALVILQHFKEMKKPKYYYTVFAIIFLIHLPFNSKSKTNELSLLDVRIVQPNIGNFMKLDSERGGMNSLNNVYETYEFLSTDKLTTKDLIIWPETAFPGLFYSEVMKNNPNYRIPELMQNIIEKSKAELFIGGYDSITKSNNQNFQSDFNSAFHFSDEGVLKEVYHKMRLIPFGEGLPFGPLNPFLSGIITNISYFAAGENYTGFKTKKGLPFVSVICYEILFPSFVRDMLNHQIEDSQFLINLTNDSWYGDTAEPKQHLFLTKWRALEFNLPIIRSTNTGISTVIYPDGSESDRMSVGEKTYLDLVVKIPKRTKTLYQSYSLWIVSGFFLILCLVELSFKRKTFFQQIMKFNKT